MPTLSTVLLFVSAFAIKILLLYGYGNQNRPFYGCGNEKVSSLVLGKTKAKLFFGFAMVF